MQTALAVILTALGVALFIWLWRLLGRLKSRLGALGEASQPADKVRSEGPIGPEGLVYLYAHDFVKPAPRRPIGSIPRDRAFACLTDDELDCDDFAKQLLYAVLTELHELGGVATQVVAREASYMPPYPHKQWELQIKQMGPFPCSPLCESLAVGFDLSRKYRMRSKRNAAELTPEEEFFALEEVLERSLKAIRQEMSFWERGSICADLRRYVETALIAQGLLNAPDRDTWLDSVRTRKSTPRREEIEQLKTEAEALQTRLEAFRKRFGSKYAVSPEQDEKGQIVDIDPQVLKQTQDLSEMPFDDVLRATIHEAVVSIKQLEPSGEAGI